jgi:tetratricopeptide (TPR) repeat protein
VKNFVTSFFDKSKNYQEIADSARDRGEWADAAEAYYKVLVADTTNAPIWVQYGHSLKESGSLPEAVEAYQKAIDLGPTVPDSYLQLGHALKIQGQFSEAVVAYISAYRLDPLCEPAIHELRQLKWSEHDLAGVASGLDNGLDINPKVGMHTRPERTLSEIGNLKKVEFNAALYRSTFPDVDLLISLGLIASAEQHYLHYGFRQGRDIVLSLAKAKPSRCFVLCPSFHKQCGIGEHARYLADSIERSGLETHRIRSTREMLDFAPEILKDAVVIVNHGPGLFDGYNPELSEGESTTDLLCCLQTAYLKHNLRPVIFMHSLLDRDNEVMFPRQQLILEFPIPIVTTISAASRVFNVFHIEHGMQPMPEFKSITPFALDGRARDYPIIGFFGFFQWGGKNFDAIFNLAGTLKAKLVGSVATRDADQVKHLHIALSERGIQCDLGTGWTDDATLAHRLSEADFHYLPQHDYDHWNNSGTARFVMNFRKPVIVPPHNPFLDLRDYVIFAEERDLPAMISWMRHEQTYQKACDRSTNYAEKYPMAVWMPLLATALPQIVGEHAAENFISANAFSAYRLLGALDSVFHARTHYALNQSAKLKGSSKHSQDRSEDIINLKRVGKSRAGLNYPVVEDVQYWRDHYELEEFMYSTSAETCVAAYRCILKREPTFIEFSAALKILNASQSLNQEGQQFAQPNGSSVVALLSLLTSSRIALPFVPTVQLYHQGQPFDLSKTKNTKFASALDFIQNNNEIPMQKVVENECSTFGALMDHNIFSLIMLPVEALKDALSARMIALGRPEISFFLEADTSVENLYTIINKELGKNGLRPSEVFLMDDFIPGPIDISRRLYWVSELFPYDGDYFIINLVRSILKRDPLVTEMFFLANMLKAESKIACMTHVSSYHWKNAAIVDINQTSNYLDIHRKLIDIRVLTERMRSPIAGGWQLRNFYLESKRDVSRHWLRLNQQKDIWWVQSGQDINKILSL